MSQYNIGPKIGVEGEAEFRRQIRNINSEYKTMDSYLKAVEQSMEKQGRSQSLLESKSAGLQQQIAIQGRKWEELNKVLDRVKEQFGEGSNEFLRISGAMLDVENTLSDLEQSLMDTDQELERLVSGTGDLTDQVEDLGDSAREVDRVTDSLDDLGDSADGAQAQVVSFGDMLKAGLASGAILNTLERVGEVIVEVGKKSIEAAADVKASNAQFEQTFAGVEAQARSALNAVADATGIAATRLQSSYTSVYAFTKSVGGDQETALNIAQRALQAAADSAAYYDRTVEDATETLQSFLKGNYANDAALGIAATETTRNAKANELYAKSFKDLTEAQKVDTLLAMVEAGNKASGALGQAAREADAWTNVTGEAAEATRQLLAVFGDPILQGLTPLIQGYTNALKGMTEVKSWQTLRADVADFQAGLAAAEAELEASNTSMAATASLAERYVGNLLELEQAGLDTAESQRKYAQTVELLNGLMPELNLSIDQNTGRLAQNTSAIYNNINGLKKRAQEQAKQAYYNRIIEESQKAYEALYAAQTRETELLAMKEELLARGATLYEGMSYAQTGSADAMAQFNAQLTEDDKALMEVQRELNGLTGEILIAEAAVAAAEGKFDSATRAMEDYGDAGEQAAESAAAQAEAQEALRKAYEAAKTAARESIDSQIGLFQELADENDWTAEKIIKNWEKQREAFAKYEENLEKAVELGLDETLVQQLSDGSQQSMMILDALVNDVDYSVDEINREFGQLGESKDSLAGTIGEMSDIVQDGLDAIAAAAEASGGDIVAGAVRGIKGNKSTLIAAMADLAKGSKSEWNHQWEINSPSRWMRQASDYIVDGGVDQLRRREPDMARAMVDLAVAGQDAYTQHQLDAVAEYPSLMVGTPGYGSAVTNNRSVNMGGVTVNIYAREGQNGADLYDEFMERMQQDYGQEVASL